jgi:hypothetical protein
MTHISLEDCPNLIKAKAVKPGGPAATKAPFAWCPSKKPVIMILCIFQIHQALRVIGTAAIPNYVDADVEKGHETAKA